MSSSVLEYLSFIQSRPNRKARQRRVIESLDERLPGWEKIFDDRDFHDWLQIFPSNGARSRADWLIDLWDAFDEGNLVTLVRLFVEEHAGLRPRKGVPLEGTPYRVGDYINSRYVVIDCLGRGGFGNVLLVYHDDRHFHEFLALKVLRDDVARERFASSRFDREANVLLALQSHPNIVGVRYVDKISGQLLILSEYIESDINGCVSLGDHIKRSGISLAKQMQWLVECCSGLSFAYKQGIVAHRDIKPENILIDRHGHARVADFGLASVSIARDNDESSGLLASSNKPAFATQQGRSLGTPPYMAPEQFVDARICTERSDVYSVGVMLYEIATGGKLPFMPSQQRIQEDVFNAFARLHINEPIPFLNSPLYHVFKRCCAKTPENRYASMRELSEAVKDVANTCGVDLRPLNLQRSPELFSKTELMNRAEGYRLLNENAKAIDLLRRALDDGDIWKDEILCLIAKNLFEMRLWEDAAESFRMVSPGYLNDEHECFFGICLHKIGDNDKAISLLSSATQKNSANSEAWGWLAQCLYAEARLHDAKAAFENYEKLPNVMAKVLIQKASLELRLSEAAKARRTLESARVRASGWDAEADDLAKKLLHEIKEFDLIGKLKPLLGSGFTFARMKDVLAILDKHDGSGSLREPDAISLIRASNPAILYSQAEQIYRLFRQSGY